MNELQVWPCWDSWERWQLSYIKFPPISEQLTAGNPRTSPFLPAGLASSGETHNQCNRGWLSRLGYTRERCNYCLHIWKKHFTLLLFSKHFILQLSERCRLCAAWDSQGTKINFWPHGVYRRPAWWLQPSPCQATKVTSPGVCPSRTHNQLRAIV